MSVDMLDAAIFIAMFYTPYVLVELAYRRYLNRRGK
jgi:hypothetical protein